MIANGAMIAHIVKIDIVGMTGLDQDIRTALSSPSTSNDVERSDDLAGTLKRPPPCLFQAGQPFAQGIQGGLGAVG